MSHMHETARNPIWLVIGISAMSAIGWFINTFEPNSFFSLTLFFIILAVATYALAYFALNNVRRALLLSLSLFLVLALRLLGLRSVFYVVIIILLVASLELYSQKR